MRVCNKEQPLTYHKRSGEKNKGDQLVPSATQSLSESSPILVPVQKTAATIPDPQHSTEGKKLVLKREVDAAFKRIVESLPEETLNNIVNLLEGRVEVTGKELADLAQLAVDFQKGKIATPSLEYYLAIRDSDQGAKIEFAKRTLQGMIARTILPEGAVQKQNAGLKRRLGYETNRLAFFLGKADGKEIVLLAISNLPTVQRVLLLGSMSTNLKQQLDYPDIEECHPEQLAEYILSILHTDFRIRKKRRDNEPSDVVIRRLSALLDECLDRDPSKCYTNKVIITLCGDDRAPYLFRRMVEVADAGNFLDNLECFFMQNQATSRFARACAQLLGNTPSDYDEDYVENEDAEFLDSIEILYEQ